MSAACLAAPPSEAAPPGDVVDVDALEAALPDCGPGGAEAAAPPARPLQQEAPQQRPTKRHRTQLLRRRSSLSTAGDALEPAPSPPPPSPLSPAVSPPEAPRPEGRGAARPCWGRLAQSGCRSVERYQKLNRIDEGTYGVVYRARDTETGEVVALKQLKLMATKSDDGFPIPSLREVILLTTVDHPNVIRLHEVVTGSTANHIFMVFEYAQHELRALLQRQQTQAAAFSAAEHKCLLRQLLHAMEHLHHRWIIHRDLKTSNILLTDKGVLKVCDFGMARRYGEPNRIYSKNVITLWYRAPELLMAARRYTAAVDMWSVGCVFAELLLRRPPFEGKSELHQLTLIYDLTGVPTEDAWPGYEQLPNRKRFGCKLSLPRWHAVFPPGGPVSEMGIELLRSLLTCCPERRMTAEAASEDPYFWERPYALGPSMMPTFTETNCTGHEQRQPVLRKFRDPLAAANGAAAAQAAQLRG